ncbi:hypothetical protein LTS17_010260 [Exophiala oligosperma]
MLSSPSKDTAQSPLLEGELEKLNAEYASAIEENQAAQSKYEDALERRRRRSQSNKGDDRDSSHNPRTLLNRHVELRSLQKRNTSFVVLKDELDKIKSLLDSAKWKVRPAAAQEQLTVPPDARNDISLLEHTLMRHVKALEMAVVQSHLEAKAEKAKLDKARVRAQSDEHGVTPEQRVRAMLTTRRHLTKWLEESLEKCQDNFGEHGGDDKDVQDPGPGQNGEVITDDMIDEQYERYLDARRRIIDAVDNLRAPIPFKGGESTEQQPHEEQGKATRQKGLGGSALDDEARATKNMLDRLSDESQLLQAFPILARSGRFEHAASAIGTKSEAREDQVGDDEVAQRIKPWLFAAEAAEVALSSNMEKQLGQGTEAMHTVSRSLAELSLLKNTKLDENFVL